MRLLAITRKPGSASFEQRVLRFVPLLAQRGIEVDCQTLPTTQRGQYALLGETAKYHGVWWHRHLLSPWWLDRLRAQTKRLVFDFDDPLIHTASGGGGPSLARRSRFRWMLGRCDAAFAASDLLAQLARPLCSNTHIVPMAIDLPDADLLAPRWNAERSTKKKIELLWLGSAATQQYLEVIRADLEALGERASKRVKLRLVAHAPMTFGKLEIDFRPWSHDEQERALVECDIGLCPMPDTVWTRGKNPFKALQYMAYGLPWIGSAVGENIATSGMNTDKPRGVCVPTISSGSPGSPSSGEWTVTLEALLADQSARVAMGKRGRAYVEKTHDRTVLVEQIATLWHSVEA